MNFNQGSAIEYNNYAVSLINRKRMESAIPILNTAVESAKSLVHSLRGIKAKPYSIPSSTSTAAYSLLAYPPSMMGLDDFMRHSSYVVRGRNTTTTASATTRTTISNISNTTNRANQFSTESEQSLSSSSSVESSIMNAASNDLLYKRGIRIPVSTRCNSYDVAVSILSAIYFNIGLAYHMIAIRKEQQEQNKISCPGCPSYESHEGTNSHFDKACQMYECAYQMQQREYSVSDTNHKPRRGFININSLTPTTSTSTSTKTTKNSLFLMATLNNLGIVYQQQKKESKAKKCFQLVLSNLILCVLDAQQQQKQQYGSELESFVQNTSHLIFQQDGSETAAAA